MIAIIQPSTISGIIQSPASKSSMQRACAAALLHNGVTVIINPGKSNDDLAALDIIRKLGAGIQTADGKLLIKSSGIPTGKNEINCGESGLGVRMFAPIAALSSQQIILNGSGSLLQRSSLFYR